MQVGIYVRLSQETDGLGLARQESDARELAKGRGWHVARVYADADSSAYKRKPRPAFEAMLSDLQSRQLDGLVVWDCDRLARQPRDLERLLDLFDQRPLGFATCQGEIDLGTTDGRFVARLMVNVANKSSADTGRRIKRKHLELAQNGVAVGGWRPFGWQADKKTLDPSESELIRQAVQDLLAGTSLRSICYRWNDAGIKTTAGNIWRHGPLKNTLTSPRLAGFRVYQRGIARDSDGQRIRGQWEPILDVPTWEALVAQLDAPRVRVGAKRYLLSGIIRCAVCSYSMVGNAHTARGTAYYTCKKPEGCGTVGISAPKTDDLITKLVLRYLGEREIQQEAEPFTGEQELAGKQARIYELMNAYGEGTLSGETVFGMVAKLEREVAELTNQKVAYLRETATFWHSPTKMSIPSIWQDLQIEQQRQIISQCLQAVAVRPAKARGGRWNAERIEAVWRSPANVPQ